MVRQILPWQAGEQLFDVFRREMEDLADRIQEAGGDDEATFAPRTNVAETATEFELSLEIPGMSADDIAIEMHEGRLTVSGERKQEEAVEGKTLHRVERRYGKFARVFKLGTEVNADKITADYANGVLTVTVPKTEKVQPKRIQVSTQS
jgi:HSP20 family protein